jgi:primosomal protein N' (replication factor Y)
MPKDTSYSIDVVPLTSVPLTRDPWFSYGSPVSIAVGSLVWIPLGQKKVRGIVVATRLGRPKNLPAFVKLKQVDRIIQAAFLTPEQIALAQHISETNFTPLGICLKHFAPTPTKARVKPDEMLPVELTTSIGEVYRPTTAQRKVIRQLNTPSTRDAKPIALFGAPATGKTETILFAMHQLLQKGGQGLFLVPELSLIDGMAERARVYWKENEIAVVHSHLSAGKLSSAWERIRSGEAKCIIGTRQALFAPFQSLRVIALDDEQSDSYKQWNMAPRYDARTLVQEMARLHRSQLVFISSTPSLRCWHAVRQGVFVGLELPRRERQTRPECLMIDLKLERWKKNFSSLAQPMVEAIDIALMRKEQTLLFVAHQGMSRFSVCVQCKTVLRCPDCERALILIRDGHYKCLHCSYKTDEFPVCSQCRHTEFRNIGIGTERVERELERKFPRATIARLDRSVLTSPAKLALTIKRFSQGKIDILIGTQAAILGWNLPNLALIGIIDADSLFANPGFQSDEKAFQLLTQAIHRSGRFEQSRRAKALIQTFHPENPVFESVTKQTIDTLYERFIVDREVLRYPPMARNILLTCRHITEKRLDNAFKKQHTSLLAFQQEAVLELRVTPFPTFSKQRGIFRKNLLLRFPLTPTVPKILDQWLRALPTEWSIDVDPISFS